jgi:SAM-dependent methyltransferase
MDPTRFVNCYADTARADSYATLEFANTYYLAYRDLPAIFAEQVQGKSALDFGCGTGRSTRFLRQCGFEAVGIDIAEEMIRRARAADAGGDYRLVANGDFSQFAPESYDLVLAVFTFDNIPGAQKVPLFTGLRTLLKRAGRLIMVVSAPEIYVNEWASFSTKDFPENGQAKSGDTVKIIVLDHADRRPVEDVIWTDASYREVFAEAGLEVTAMYKPLAGGDEPYPWVSEREIAPWVIYVLQRA